MENKNLISWKFPEHTVPQRKKSWYVWAVIVFIGLLIYSALTANFLFGLIIIIVTIILFIYQYKEALDVEFAITPDGIQAEDRFYEYKDIKKFWLLYEPPEVKNLYFEFKASLRPTLIIPLLDNNPLKVRSVLKEYLEEDLEKESESTTEALARVFKL